MGIASWVVLGAIAGLLTKVFIGRSERALITVGLGIVGAMVGGFIGSAIFNKGDLTGVTLESVVLSVLGAILVLLERVAWDSSTNLETEDQPEMTLASMIPQPHGVMKKRG